MGYRLNFCRWGVSPPDIRKTGNAVTLQAPMQRRPCQVRDRGLQGIETIIQRQQRMSSEGDTAASPSSLRTVDRGSFGLVFKSSTVTRFRHFRDGLGVDPQLPAQLRERSLRSFGPSLEPCMDGSRVTRGR